MTLADSNLSVFLRSPKVTGDIESVEQQVLIRNQ